jgi:hypothetical protein
LNNPQWISRVNNLSGKSFRSIAESDFINQISALDAAVGPEGVVALAFQVIYASFLY